MSTQTTSGPHRPRIVQAVTGWLREAWAAGAGARAMASRNVAHDGYGFSCRDCGRTGGPWATRDEAAQLATIHDRLEHRMHPGCRLAEVVPAGVLRDRPHGGPGPGAYRIQVGGLSVPARTVTR